MIDQCKRLHRGVISRIWLDVEPEAQRGPPPFEVYELGIPLMKPAGLRLLVHT